MTPGISNSPRHCSHHHYHHHHCYAHTHCHINQNCRGDVPPPQPPPAPPQRHEEDNLDGEDDGEGMEEDYDDDEDEDIDDGNELGDEDPKRYYHHYHHLIGQPVSPQHHHHQQQQNHKSYDITDAPGSYTNLEQNKTVRGYFPFDNIHTGQDESRLPLGNKTGIIGGDTLAYIDDYHDPSIEYYSRLNRSPKDWKTNRGETDHIRSSQQSQLSTLVQYTGNNSKKYDIRLTGTLPSVSSSAMSAVSSVPFSHLTVENFRDSNLTTISLSTSSDCMPDSVQTNLTNSLSFLPTNISLDYLNPIWRNQSAHKMNQSLSDIPIQIDNNDNDNNNNNNNNGDDRDSTSKQIHSRLLINQIQNSKFEFSKQITTQSDNGVITVVNVGDGDGDEEEDDDGDGDGDENRSIWSLNAIQQQGECNNNTEIIPINQSNFLTMNSMNFESASGVRDSSLLMTG
uniref:Uncharacterized protein n=1 Tax=Trichobilharzia regenti TaxID=157069 RepID=A0AA85KEG8_TRIRE|nr:unnamed protein product [Trichobilharzia regenti]